MTLANLWKLTDRFQRALSGVASQLAGSSEPNVAFEITKAHVGSLDLGVSAVALTPTAPDPDTVLATFSHDLDDIRRRRFRPGLTANMISTYQKLVRDLTSKNETLEVRYRDFEVTIDETYGTDLEIALKETIATDIVVTGYLDAVIAHKAPFYFHLYPKLDQRHKIECRFPHALRPAIAEVFKERALVQVSGTGRFGPVGIYPTRIDIDRAPERLVFHATTLLSLLGTLPIVPTGMSAADYLAGRRHELGTDE